MKRFHVHITVTDLDQSIQFYSNFFNIEPTVKKEDYAKWMLDDPRINFAISTRGKEPGLDHLGIQVEDTNDLKVITKRLKTAQQPVLEQEQATCCYAKSDKTWVVDPQGIAWEAFLTMGSATIYGDENNMTAGIPMHRQTACCAPEVESVQVEIKRK